ncbi:hypothetical protein C8R44DRAFT_922522 [Mycena epipterygia]|nr:hypothetical protein C8R44DRAFT_922522 [Mycena epipterygia]
MHSSALVILVLALTTLAAPAPHRFGRPQNAGFPGFGRPDISKGHKVAGGNDLQNSSSTLRKWFNFFFGSFSLTALDASVVQKGFLNDGQNPPVDGQFPSLTSYQSRCIQTRLLLMNPKRKQLHQLLRAHPAGNSPYQCTTNYYRHLDHWFLHLSVLSLPTSRMPSSKFKHPKNLDTIPANTAFNISMAFNNVDNAAMIHQPVIMLIAQHGNLDDCVYVISTTPWHSLQSTLPQFIAK